MNSRTTLPYCLLICLLLSGCGGNKPLSMASLSAASFDFGNNIVGNTLTHSVVDLRNLGTQPLEFNPTLSGDPSFSLVPSQACTGTLAPLTSCSVLVAYLPSTASGTTSQSATLNLNLKNVSSQTSQGVSLTGTAAVLPPGVVTPTHNPQVALYTMTLPYPGSISVNFGKTTSYGLQTWSQTAAANGGQVSILVAGMTASSTYHMQAAVRFTGGLSVADVDHTFPTGVPVAGAVPVLSVTTTPGLTPQPGLELTNATSIGSGGSNGIAVADLSGNIVWTYPVPSGALAIDGVKLLPNGDFLMVVGTTSAAPLDPGEAGESLVSGREVNLAGDTVRELTLPSLNSELAAAGYPLTLQDFHHDITPLPNGHWLILANTLREEDNLTGYSGPVGVLGDVVIDLDTDLKPVWMWNEFDHLDINRHPYQFPDWTHSNAIVYSKDDGNILVSIRHQNWVVKVDYEDGKGNGNILWKLGQGGDFALQGGVDPTDWFYAQHYPSFFTTNTSGVFSLGLMDNGDDRAFATGVNCDTGGSPPCHYSTIPVFQINEANKTATFQFHQILPGSLYSNFGGSMQQLANGNIEYDLCGVGTDSDVFEVTNQSSPQNVWHLHSSGSNLYRASRIPSLYPGVQW